MKTLEEMIMELAESGSRLEIRHLPNVEGPDRFNVILYVPKSDRTCSYASWPCPTPSYGIERLHETQFTPTAEELLKRAFEILTVGCYGETVPEWQEDYKRFLEKEGQK
jgi:hypothetical protein